MLPSRFTPNVEIDKKSPRKLIDNEGKEMPLELQLSKSRTLDPPISKPIAEHQIDPLEFVPKFR